MRSSVWLVIISPHERFGYMKASKYRLSSKDEKFLEGGYEDFDAYVDEEIECLAGERGGICMREAEYSALPDFSEVPKLGTLADEWGGSELLGLGKKQKVKQ